MKTVNCTIQAPHPLTPKKQPLSQHIQKAKSDLHSKFKKNKKALLNITAKVMKNTAITRLKTGIQKKQVLFVAQYFACFQSVKNAIYTLNWCIIIAALKGKRVFSCLQILTSSYLTRLLNTGYEGWGISADVPQRSFLAFNFMEFLYDNVFNGRTEKGRMYNIRWWLDRSGHHSKGECP